MKAEQIAVLLVIAAAVPATLFPILYGFTAPWWRSNLGRALMTSSVGLALLIDLSLVHQFLRVEIPDPIRLVVYSLIVAGAWMQFLVFGRIQARRWADVRRRHH